jgi:hypothetical protein
MAYGGLSFMTTKTAKMVSFWNIWSVFHLTTHEKRKTDQNYKKNIQNIA